MVYERMLEYDERLSERKLKGFSMAQEIFEANTEKYQEAHS